MKSETLKDFLEWTQKFHQKNATCMKDCADNNEDERSRMLHKYVSKNEKELATIIARFVETADEKALNTWTHETETERHESNDRIMAVYIFC